MHPLGDKWNLKFVFLRLQNGAAPLVLHFKTNTTESLKFVFFSLTITFMPLKQSEKYFLKSCSDKSCCVSLILTGYSKFNWDAVRKG